MPRSLVKPRKVKPVPARFEGAEPHMPLIPRCQAAVGKRQCSNEATRADLSITSAKRVWCGTHFNQLKRSIANGPQ